ncbi:MAG: hypothetical protein H7Y33_15440 [Cytophagales bacterium]|nr:hypothetical protein [Rhizobacter sp.]
MKRIHLAASGLVLSCLLTACGGNSSTDNPTPDATAQTETAQDAVRMQAQAARRPAPEQFTGRLREVDETLVWQQTEMTVGNTTAQRTYSDHVTAVNADGSFAFERFNGAGSVFERYTSDTNGSRLSRDVVANGNRCSFNPGRNFVSFPLYVGKVWLSNWTQACTLGYQETVNQLTAVTGRETIAIAAGSYDALRLNYVTLITKSNDANLQNGSTGEASYLQEATCWWATDIKRIVKCSYKNTYFGSTPPASYLKSYSFEASFVGKQYFAGTKRVGQNNAWAETNTLVDGTPQTRNYHQIVRTLNADGGYGADYVDLGGALLESYTFDKDDNRLRRFTAFNSNTCTYSPRRNFFDFPLYVGKSWSTDWLYNCSSGYHENATHTAQVQAMESVTVGAGTFDALRIQYQTQFTNSNDAGLLNGVSGSATYSQEGTCWWAPTLKRMIKCDIDSNFGATAPASYRKRYAMSMTAIVVP